MSSNNTTTTKHIEMVSLAEAADLVERPMSEIRQHVIRGRIYGTLGERPMVGRLSVLQFYATTDLPSVAGDLSQEELVSATKAARMLKCHLNSLHRWRVQGKLRAFKRAGRWFFALSDVRAMFQPTQAPPMPDTRAERERKERAVQEYLKSLGY